MLTKTEPHPRLSILIFFWLGDFSFFGGLLDFCAEIVVASPHRPLVPVGLGDIGGRQQGRPA
jgi:hypothetical protein